MARAFAVERASSALVSLMVCTAVHTLLLLLLPGASLTLSMAPQVAEAMLVGAAVLPHGDFALDPGLIHNANGSVAVHNACVKAGATLSALKPDLVVLSSPHGVEDSNAFALYANTNGTGYALIGQDMHNASFPTYRVPMNLSLAPQKAKALWTAMHDGDNGAGGVRQPPQAASAMSVGANVSTLMAWADSEPMPLRWGEVVPLWFMRNYLNTSRGAGAGPPQTLVLSQPTRRYNYSVEMIPELDAVGAAMGQYLESLPERVLVIVSADLAHTHEASGPYGYSTAAAPFDKACGVWAGSLNRSALVVEAARYVDKALSCGFTGMVMLDGMMRGVTVTREGRDGGGDGDGDGDGGGGHGDVHGDGGVLGASGGLGGGVRGRAAGGGHNTASGAAIAISGWRASLLAEAAPTYYGMLVATFAPVRDSRQAL